MNGTNSDNAISIQTMVTQTMVTQKMVGRNMVPWNMVPRNMVTPNMVDWNLVTPNMVCRNLVTLNMVTPKLLGTRFTPNTTILWCSTSVKYFILFFFSKNLKKYKRGPFFRGIAKLGHYE